MRLALPGISQPLVRPPISWKPPGPERHLPLPLIPLLLVSVRFTIEAVVKNIFAPVQTSTF